MTFSVRGTRQELPLPGRIFSRTSPPPKPGFGIAALPGCGGAGTLRAMDDLLPLPLVVAPTFLLAGLVKGVIGLGLPTVAVGLLGLVMAPAQAAALLVVPSLVTNLWQLAAGPSLARLLRRLWPMLLAVCLGTWAGGGLLAGAGDGRATLALGAAQVLYAASGLARARIRVAPRAEAWLAPLIGAATGLVTAATGVFVIPAVPYLQALALDKEDLVQALGLAFTVSTLALAADLAQGGVLRGAFAAGSLLALVPALAGMTLGQWLHRRVRPERFRLFFFLGLLALGGHLALSGVLATSSTAAARTAGAVPDDMAKHD